MNVYKGYSETELIALLKLGDPDALSALYYLHVKQLKFYVQKYTKSPFLADDIVHDTFIKLWEGRMQIDPSQSLKPYLFTIAKRNLLNMFKRAQHETAILSEMRRHSTTQENTTEMQLDYNESNAMISDAIDTLPRKCKEVFIRCRLQGQTYKQAADELGITESTVNKHMSHAINLIREYINLRNAVALLMASIAVHSYIK